MKKYIFTSSLIIASALSVMAESVIVEGGTSRTPLKAGYDNILKSGTGDLFSGNYSYPPIVTSIDGATYKPAGGKWNFAYKAIVDINSDTEGDVMAVNFAGNNVEWRIQGIVVKNTNTNASNTVATINVGTGLRFVTNDATQFTGLDIQTNAKVEGNMSLTSQGGGSNFLNIAENCTVDYTAGVTYVAERAHIDVGAGATLRHNGTITAYDKSAINVAKGGRLEVANLNFSNAPTAAVNVAGTMVFTGTRATLSNVNLTGSVIAKDLELGTNGRLRFTGANNLLGTGSAVDIRGAIEVKSGSLVIDEGCESIIVRDHNYSGTLYEGRVMLVGDASITYNKDNAVTRINEAGTKTFDKTNLLITGANNKLVINADVQYADIRAFGGASDLTVVLSDNADDILLFGRLTSDGSSLAISIENFSDNRVFIATSSSSPYIVDGITISVDTGAELEFVAGTYNSTKGFWLNAAAVPEPAEWAVIFGTLALGLAMYRRRK